MTSSTDPSPASKVLVRPAVPADTPACAAIFRAGRRRARPHVPAERFTLDDFDRAVEGIDVWVAEAEGRIAGFVTLNREEAMIEHLYVDPDFQGRRLGTRLFDHGVGLLGPKARLECCADNRKAIEFYLSLGCVPLEEWYGAIRFAAGTARRRAA